MFCSPPSEWPDSLITSQSGPSGGRRERAILLLPSRPQGPPVPSLGLHPVATKRRQPGGWKWPPGPTAAPKAEIVTRAWRVCWGQTLGPGATLLLRLPPEKSGHRDGELAADTELGLPGLSWSSRERSMRAGDMGLTGACLERGWEFGVFIESEVAQSCLAVCSPMDCSRPGSSIRGILQARRLEWGAISFSRGSSRPRDRTWVSCIIGRRFII